MAHFELSEYVLRINNTKKKMQEYGIDVLVISDPANINYLSGYDGWSFYVPQYLVLSIDRDEPIWVGRFMDTAGAIITSCISEDNIFGYPDDYVQSCEKHPMEFVASLFEKYHWSNKNVGLELDAYYFTAKSASIFERSLPNAKVKDGTNIVNWVRAIKSFTEIQYMKEAAKITEKAIQIAIDKVEPGVRQCDVIAHIYNTQIKGTEDYGGDYTAICPFLLTGVNSSAPHVTWSDKPIQNNEIVVMELSGARLHYHSPLARTLYLGTPPDELISLSNIVIEGLYKVLDFIRPGVTCEEIEAVWRNNALKYNITKDSRIGYSVGLGYPPDFGEHTLSLRPGDKTIIKENMTIHIIPSIWLRKWGVEISETISVTANSANSLASVPRELILKA